MTRDNTTIAPARRTEAPGASTRLRGRLRSARRLGVLGPFGFGNLGDAAIQDAVLDNVRRRLPGIELVGISLNPDDTIARHGIPARPIGRMAAGGWSGHASFAARLHRQLPRGRLGRLLRGVLATGLEPLGLMRALRVAGRLDVLVISGGGQLDDYWGGAWHHPYSLLLWTAAFKLRRKPVVMLSLGAGPLASRLSRMMTTITLRLVDYRSLRDEDSRRYVKEATGFDRGDPVYPDLAFSLEPVARAAAKKRPGERTVAVGPMAYFDPRIWPERDGRVYGDYLERLAAVVEGLERRGDRVVMFPGEAFQDRAVITDLAGLLGRRAATGQPLETPDVWTVPQLLDVLQEADAVVAGRFHGVLLPLLLGKPTIATAYHAKVWKLMEAASLERYCFDIRSFQPADVLGAVDDAFDREDVLTGQIRAWSAQNRARLDEQYDALFGAPGSH